jgi:acetyl esterase/lipase
LGESAGGHLALLYGYQNPDKIKKIISLSGPTDFYSPEYLNSFYSKYSSPTIQKVVGTKFLRKNLSEEFKSQPDCPYFECSYPSFQEIRIF